MGKIIDKVRQREFDAMLYRRALDREAESSKWLQDLGPTVKTRAWREFVSFPLLPTGKQSR